MGLPSTLLLNEIQSLTPRMWHIVATATSTAMGKGQHWLPSTYKHAVASIPKPSRLSKDIPIPRNFEDDPLARRKIVRQMKETLNKSITLIGIPKVIEAGFAFDPAIDPADNDALAPYEKEDDAILRRSINLDDKTTDRAYQSLRRIYQHNLDPILSRFGSMTELRWLTINLTYGVYLSPSRPWDPSAPLTSPETEAVVLSSMIAQSCERELLWHLRCSLRSGLTHEEIENIQTSIEKVAIACGACPDQLKSLPRVTDVTDVDDLS